MYVWNLGLLSGIGANLEQDKIESQESQESQETQELLRSPKANQLSFPKIEP